MPFDTAPSYLSCAMRNLRSFVCRSATTSANRLAVSCHLSSSCDWAALPDTASDSVLPPSCPLASGCDDSSKLPLPVCAWFRSCDWTASWGVRVLPPHACAGGSSTIDWTASWGALPPHACAGGSSTAGTGPCSQAACSVLGAVGCCGGRDPVLEAVRSCVRRGSGAGRR